ncbi:11S globulin seed storage protein 2-like [Impatiens glandulifera]|uniref:11S globulin seed storage protein 2-like n=1 Tax=Impatiens glandulifera TaxID=253017 RepID=UPI001FB11B2F|nr:11S globulin seed storage protein 2-like [Impatiens glandulifera]
MAKGNQLAIFLCFFACISLVASTSTEEIRQAEKHGRLTQAQQCRIQHISAKQPSQKIENEGGLIEIWEQNDDMFQCSGVASFRYTIRSNGLSLPQYHSSPRLVFVERGEGLVGLNFPGCAETFQSGSDSHQKVHRIRKGDLFAIPQGVAYWIFNDCSDDLVTVAVNDLSQIGNQLDHQFRAFYMAGGETETSEKYFQNLFQHFDTELIAESLSMPVEVMRKIQEGDQTRKGYIVTVRKGMSIIRPDEREQGEWSPRGNGIEENSWCSMEIRHNMESRQESDVYSRQGGRAYSVNQNKLPILRLLDMSAAKLQVFPNAIYSPSWNVNGHTVVYVTKGEAEVQIVDQSGQTMMNERVREGDMFVIPQFFVATSRAGENGFESVAFKTTSVSMKSQLAGYTSVMRGMPIQVIENIYKVSPSQAKDLKFNTGSQSLFMSSSRTTGFSS